MNKDKIIIGLLILSLLFQWFSWSNIAILENQVNNLRNEIHSINSTVYSETSNVRQIVQGIREDAQWWGKDEVEFLKVTRERSTVKVSWQLKEYQDGASVQFYYQPSNQDTYIESKVTEVSKGYFSTTFEFENTLEPFIHSSIRRETYGPNQRDSYFQEEAITIMDDMKGGHPNQSIKYYISLTHAGNAQFTDVRYIDHGEIQHQLFKSLSVHGHIGKDNFHFSLFEEGKQNTQYNLVEAWVENRDEEFQLLERWEFELQDNYTSSGKKVVNQSENGYHPRNFQFNQSIPQDQLNQLYLVIQYPDNIKVERRIFTK
ncbi:hypothetical protein BHU72_08580 [Desulfuribacillus stibiiarsenatis]|uniref:Uncharacterized protein n=1 Tax=Desulfuribacillus stibiiarsenatis TaxID=1390249 RepID=A0A1E5L3B3_9FIRM|nr:hypothetical protein [Desulfuribacillus stibiiarsenatis]OEH84553.1 hypothetical protein BHU72_08580 [Desulfuribacillus stibiiarsenatis]